MALNDIRALSVSKPANVIRFLRLTVHHLFSNLELEPIRARVGGERSRLDPEYTTQAAYIVYLFSYISDFPPFPFSARLLRI